jgi:hypothetical protein
VREDMAKVIVERPRIIDYYPRKGRARPLEELPKQLGMRRSQQERHGEKVLNENLAPLRRFLMRQVGRPWDKVYSEIAARLRADNTVQQHVRDHLEDFVAIRARKGISTGYRRGDDVLWWQPLYVDPRDGILKRTDRLPEVKAGRRQQRRQKGAVERIELSKTRQLRRMDGIWYEITLAPLPEPEYEPFVEVRNVHLRRYKRNRSLADNEVWTRRLVSPPVVDLATGQVVYPGPAVDTETAWWWFRRDHPDRRYAVAKRQLSRRELRRHGLANKADDEA